MKAQIFVEGGAKGARFLNAACREGFRQFIQKLHLRVTPRIVASGGRNDAIHDFQTAIKKKAVDDIVLLLIESEKPVEDIQNPSVIVSLKIPHNQNMDDCVILMVTCMETWFVADRETLQAFFGSGFRENALPALPNIEQKLPTDIFACLKRATKECSKNYEKGAMSYEILIGIRPETVASSCASAERCIQLLRKHWG